jgi:hypothetical protein
MVAYVFFRRDIAIPHLDALKEEASRRAEYFGLKELDWWCETVADCERRWIAAEIEVTRTAKYHGDDIVFVFAKGDKGRDAAMIFIFNCKLPCWSNWPES